MIRASAAAPLALAAALAAFAAAAEPRSVSGEAAYRERIALPEDAVLTVETRDLSGALFAETRRRAGGRQVPFAFAIEGPRAGGTVRVSIAPAGAGPRWLSPELPLPPGEAPLDLGAVMLEREIPMAFVSRMRCGDETLRVGADGPDLVIEARGLRRRLAPDPAASGARYAAAGDPGTFFRSEGAAATVSLAGAALPECRVEAPPTPPPEFRAGGTEPGWSFEIAGGRLALTLDYGAERREAPAPPPEPGPEGTVIASEALGAVVRIEDRLCRDAATGMPHPATVTVETGGARLAGCGGRPLDLLLGGEWRIVDLAGAGIAPGSAPAVEFRADGRAGGAGSCNRWRADFSLTGESLSFGRAVSTMMACAGDLMEQERRLFDALGAVAGFDFAEDGALVLRAADGRALVTARR